MRGKKFFQNDEEGTGAQEREREKKNFFKAILTTTYFLKWKNYVEIVLMSFEDSSCYRL